MNYLDWLFRDNALVELAHQTGRNVFERGLYSDPMEFRRAAKARMGKGNLFSSLNRPREIDPYAIRRGSGLKNDDMERITRIPFDFDPQRSVGQSSTDAELAQAMQRATFLDGLLRSMGWPEPARGMSGNGAHRVYRCALPNDSETSGMLTAIFGGLDTLISDDMVQFDSTVRNPGRIFCLYGSTKRKGVDSPERPHRQSRIEVPQDWQQVDRRRVASLAEYMQRETRKAFEERPRSRPASPGQQRGDLNTLDVVGLFQGVGLYLRPSPDPCKHYVRCPWDNEHSTATTPLATSTVIYEIDGNQWPNFHCSHDHCRNRKIADVVRQFDVSPYCREAYKGRGNG